MQPVHRQSLIKATPIMGTLIALFLLAALAAPASADPLPPATSFGQVGGNLGGTTLAGPTPGSLSLSYDQSAGNSAGYIHEVANVSTDIGPGVPLVGSVIASVDGFDTRLGGVPAQPGALGRVTFYFSVDQIKIPTVAPTTIPVYFEARGQGSIEAGYGNYRATAAIVGVPGAGFDTGAYEGFTHTSSFDQSVSVYLQPSTTYEVMIGAACSVIAPETGPQSTAQAAVDPSISFDQAAFDLKYGSNSFPLAEYYHIDFSPNVPLAAVPLPSTMLFLGCGLVGLVGFRRKLKK